ncbi:uncharacterized protein LOC120536766 isoform X2 [Polypterus senegalus]|uniref:uncharacterized protein LOC120536766 isoform X2 n=1 Tax=Polypterus senegalus TaxID=55291 RepID=UPI0019636338|nr:uncharacterized protein LOC120536766 isoform X2 [Polypterus senegalus]
MSPVFRLPQLHDAAAPLASQLDCRMHTWLVVPVILASVSPLLAFEMICEPPFLQRPVAHHVSLRCFWKCESKCAAERIIWSKDNRILQERSPLENHSPTVNDRFQFIYQNIENEEVSLNIENLQLSDEGTYNCIVITSEAYREGTINLQVSEFVVPAAAGLVFVIAVVIALRMKKPGCSHCQKKFPNTGYGEESNGSSGSDLLS